MNEQRLWRMLLENAPYSAARSQTPKDFLFGHAATPVDCAMSARRHAHSSLVVRSSKSAWAVCGTLQGGDPCAKGGSHLALGVQHMVRKCASATLPSHREGGKLGPLDRSDRHQRIPAPSRPWLLRRVCVLTGPRSAVHSAGNVLSAAEPTTWSVAADAVGCRGWWRGVAVRSCGPSTVVVVANPDCGSRRWCAATNGSPFYRRSLRFTSRSSWCQGRGWRCW